MEDIRRLLGVDHPIARELRHLVADIMRDEAWQAVPVPDDDEDRR